jgi:hypothetical protein
MRHGLWLSIIVSAARAARYMVASVVTMVAIVGCSENGATTAGETSCRLKSFTVDYDKSRMCIYSCKGGELEGRTRTAAQGACLQYISGS